MPIIRSMWRSLASNQWICLRENFRSDKGDWWKLGQNCVERNCWPIGTLCSRVVELRQSRLCSRFRKMKHPIHRIESFEQTGTFTLRIRFADGVVQTIDFEPILKGEIFGPLRDPVVFGQVNLDPEI